MPVDSRARRKNRIRRKVRGTPERPRLTIYRSLRSLYAQVVDDTAGKTLAAGELRGKKNQAAGKELGDTFGKKLSEAKISAVVFDRNGYRYHGVVKAFADAVRASGVKF